MLFVWGVIVALISVNALYVAAEFAAVGVRRSRVQQLATEGNALARLLLPVVEDTARLDRYIAACQIGITFSSLVLGAFGQATLAVALVPYFAEWGNLSTVAAQSTAAVAVLIGLTILQVVLGELVPKSLALQYPTQMALYTVLPMRWSLVLYAGFIVVLNGSGILILRLLGVPPGGHHHIHSPDEIDMLIAESSNGGLLEPEEQRRLHQALQLEMRPVRQIMVPRRDIMALNIDTPIEEVLRIIASSPYTRLPVYRGSIDNVIGMAHTKAIVARFIEDGELRSLHDVLRPVFAVPEQVTVDRLLTQFKEQRCHQAIVMDESGGTEGLVTLEDVLSEMLGGVADEFKVGATPPERLPDGRVRLPGRLRLGDVEPWVGTEWRGPADTVGGLVFQRLGRLAEPGDRLVIDGVEVEVETTQENAITSVLAVPVIRGEDNDG